jgi:hypothetical protein
MISETPDKVNYVLEEGPKKAEAVDVECLRNFIPLASGKVRLMAEPVVKDLLKFTENWPKRVGHELFVRTKNHQPRYLRTPAQLFGWLNI